MMHYVAILIASEGGHWRALIPDVPECHAKGYGLLAARKAVAESLMRIAEIEHDGELLIRNGVDFQKAIVTTVWWPGAISSASIGHA